MRKLFLFCWLFTSLQSAWAQESLALVTTVKGEVNSQGHALQSLDFLDDQQVVSVSEGGILALSYVKGGTRVTVTGPAQVRLDSAKPRLLQGTPAQLTVTKAKRRAGVALPDKVDFRDSGALRRAVFGLFLPRKVLPGAQQFAYSVPTGSRETRLWVFDASSQQEAYRGEPADGSVFRLPAGALKAGHSYEFVLEARDAAGKTTQYKTEPVVVVVTEEVANELEVLSKNHNLTDRVEYLMNLNEIGLDQQALTVVESLLQEGLTGKSLSRLRRGLRSQLYPAAN